MSEIKALEWRKINVDGEVMYRARKPFGSSYYITELLESYDWNGTTFDTLEAAQAAAQADYEARILSAPVSTPPAAPVRVAAERIEDMRLAAASIREWMPETLPANEDGQIHFARALAESAATAIEKFIGSTPPAAPIPTPEMIEAAWHAYQSCPIDLCGDHDEEQKKSVAAALRAALSASPSPVDSRDGLEAARMAHRETLDLLHIRNEKLNAAEQRIERLVKALKPFAQAASVLRTVERTTGREFKDEDAFQSGLAWNNDGIVTTITYGHLRAARAALAAKEQQP